MKQGSLFDLKPVAKGSMLSTGTEMFAYVNDEVANSLVFVPQAARFNEYEDYKAFLIEKLPYNSALTRQRRARYILSRFFPNERLDTPLTYFVGKCSKDALRSVVFYHILLAEPLARKVADELVWPSLPYGHIEREQIREFILRFLPALGASSQKNTIRSLLTTYNLLGVGKRDRETLYFQVRPGTLEAFVYILTSEFYEAGIYSFEHLENGPMRHWLLWDREWMHQQLYALQELDIVTKVSEIDTVRQFTLREDHRGALESFFDKFQHHEL